MAVTAVPRNLLTVLEVSFADDPRRTGSSNPKLNWVSAVASLDEIEARARYGEWRAL